MVTAQHAFSGEVAISAGPVLLPGVLEIPAGAPGVVLFAHGSGSSRFSSRNRFVAEVLRRGGLGTLLFDLLTEPEAADRANVFDIPLLASRLAAAADWLRAARDIPSWGDGSGGERRGGAAPGRIAGDRPVAYFGASTGAAAALVAAADDPSIASIVSRGGRPDLAGEALPRVKAPTLLIVGGDDHLVVDLNRDALERLACPRELAVIPGATHLFEEPGALEQVAHLALDWFRRHF